MVYITLYIRIFKHDFLEDYLLVSRYQKLCHDKGQVKIHMSLDDVLFWQRRFQVLKQTELEKKSSPRVIHDLIDIIFQVWQKKQQGN